MSVGLCLVWSGLAPARKKGGPRNDSKRGGGRRRCELQNHSAHKTMCSAHLPELVLAVRAKQSHQTEVALLECCGSFSSTALIDSCPLSLSLSL